MINDNELVKLLAQKHVINLQGSTLLFLIKTLKEKATALMLKDAIERGHSPTVEEAIERSKQDKEQNVTGMVAVMLLNQASRIFGKDFVQAYLEDKAKSPKLSEEEVQKLADEWSDTVSNKHMDS